MQIVVKAARDHDAELPGLMKECLGSLAPRASDLKVSRVFPEGTPGNRGRMFTADVPGEPDVAAVQAALVALRKHPGVEYAEVTAEKRIM